MEKYAKIHLSHTTVHLLRRTLPSQKEVPLLHAPSIEYWQPECEQNYHVDPQSALGASGTLDNFAYPFLALPGYFSIVSILQSAYSTQQCTPKQIRQI